MGDPWTTFYRWDWFRREQWRPTLQERAAASEMVMAFQALFDPAGARVLDCSCGFGAKAMVLREAGFDIAGSDGCALAVEKAQERAASEGVNIEYFVSSWAELPERTSLRFDAVLNDALSWVTSEEQMRASIAGLRDVLRPRGVLVFTGASQAGPPSRGVEVMRAKYESLPKFAIEWSHAAGGVECTCVIAREWRDAGMDEHRLYIVREGGATRLETSTIRQPSMWDWPALDQLFREAGFAELRTEAVSIGGRRLEANLAVR